MVVKRSAAVGKELVLRKSTPPNLTLVKRAQSVIGELVGAVSHNSNFLS
jgi:hypothetical protein